MPTSLASLHEDVLRLVLSDLTHEDGARDLQSLSRLSRTCKRLNHLAIPLLYETVIWKDGYRYKKLGSAVSGHIKHILLDLGPERGSNKKRRLRPGPIHEHFAVSHVYVYDWATLNSGAIFEIWPASEADCKTTLLPGYVKRVVTRPLDAIKLQLPNFDAVIPQLSPFWHPRTNIQIEYDGMQPAFALPRAFLTMHEEWVGTSRDVAFSMAVDSADAVAVARQLAEALSNMAPLQSTHTHTLNVILQIHLHSTGGKHDTQTRRQAQSEGGGVLQASVDGLLERSSRRMALDIQIQDDQGRYLVEAYGNQRARREGDASSVDSSVVDGAPGSDESEMSEDFDDYDGSQDGGEYAYHGGGGPYVGANFGRILSQFGLVGEEGAARWAEQVRLLGEQMARARARYPEDGSDDM